MYLMTFAQNEKMTHLNNGVEAIQIGVFPFLYNIAIYIFIAWVRYFCIVLPKRYPQ